MWMVRHHPLKSACESFAFQRCLCHGWRDGLGSLPIALFLTRWVELCLCPDLAQGLEGRLWEALLCLNLPCWEASQLHLRGRMNLQRLRGRRTLGLGCQRAWVRSSIQVIPSAYSRQPWVWTQQKLSEPIFLYEKQQTLPPLKEIKWTDAGKALNTVWTHITFPFSFSHEQRLAL